MTINLTKKIAIVTGGASGIGLAIARRFADAGAAVEILDLNESELESAAAGIREQGGDAVTSVCDVSNAAQVDEVISAIHARRGRIDILVNNAGIAHVGNALTTTPEDFDRVQRVNVFGRRQLPAHSSAVHGRRRRWWGDSESRFDAFGLRDPGSLCLCDE